jgi:hypothetical protein
MSDITLEAVRQWWDARLDRERQLILLAVGVLIFAGFVLWAEALWRFYKQRPLLEAQAMQRRWLIEDIERWEKAGGASLPSVSPTNGGFLSQVGKLGVNGSCMTEPPVLPAQQAWQCKGQLAQLEAVQQWWLQGRREGYYVEQFEAVQQAPGVIRWTMAVRR